MSFLDEKGRPGVTERASIVPPGSQLGPLPDAGVRGVSSALPGWLNKASLWQSARGTLVEAAGQLGHA